MSIIHDALKKVQTNNPAGTHYASESPETDTAQTLATKNITPEATHNSLTILMAIVLSVVIIVIFAILYKFASATTEHPKKSPQTTVVAEAVQTPKTIVEKIIPPALTKLIPQTKPIQSVKTDLPTLSKPTPPAASFDGIHIEGVMNMGGKMIALINGGVYEEGQTVNGKIIAKITFENITVFMLENGEKEILPIRPSNR